MLYLGARKAVLSASTTLVQQIASLFMQGQQGVWYDPSDWATLYQDSAGTMPVTAVGQPVGLMLDKSGRGNHSSQPTAINRPVLQARVNLLSKTEQFNDVFWVKGGGGTGLAPVVTANASTAPDGSMTADRIVFDKGTGTTATEQSQMSAGSAVLTVTGKPTVAFIWLKSATASNYLMRFDFGGAASAGASFPSLITVTPVWQRFEIRLGSATDINRRITLRLRGATGTDNFADIFAWGGQQENAAFPSAYQRVNTDADYDAVGFPNYLVFNGTNSWMQTGLIDFTATDKMTLVTGIRKISDAAVAVLAELSANFNNNNGSFAVCAPVSAGIGGLPFISKGTLIQSAASNTVPAPITVVVAGVSNISGDTVTLKFNGLQVAANTSDQGAGNYGNYPLYIGARAGAGLFFNGQLYGLVIRGALSSDTQIAACERFMAQKTGILI